MELVRVTLQDFTLGELITGDCWLGDMVDVWDQEYVSVCVVDLVVRRPLVLWYSESFSYMVYS